LGTDASFFVEIISNLGALGFILWLVWRTTNHTIPRLAESFEKGIKEAREDHRVSLDQQRQDFRESLGESREFYAKQLETQRLHNDKFLETIRESLTGS
jgi:hypothetical protein